MTREGAKGKSLLLTERSWRLLGSFQECPNSPAQQGQQEHRAD